MKKILKLTTFIFVSIAIFFGLATTFNYTKDNKNNNTNSNSLTKTNIENITKGEVKQISMTDTTSAAVIHNNLDDEDHLYMWGKDDEGQQGNGPASSATIKTPTEVMLLTSILTAKNATIKQISMSYITSSAVIHSSLDDKDHLYMWGDNGWDQQGAEGHGNIYSPTEIEGLNKILTKNATIKQISMSSSTSSAVIHDAKGKDHLYMWGGNYSGQQGNGTSAYEGVIQPKEVMAVTNILNESNGTIEQISMSKITSSVVIKKADGKDHLYIWGQNDQGQQGNGTVSNPILNPTEVQAPAKGWGGEMKQISMAPLNSSVIIKKADGKDHLYMWGDNSRNQQGKDSTDAVLHPTEVEEFNILNKENATIKQFSIMSGTPVTVININSGKHKGNHLYVWGDGKNKTPFEVAKWNNILNEENATIKQFSRTAAVIHSNSDNKDHLYINAITTPAKINNTDISIPGYQKNNIKITQTDLNKDKLEFKLDEHANIIADTFFNTKKINISKISLVDGHGTQLGKSLTRNIEFDKNYAIEFKQDLGKHIYGDYSLKYSYKTSENNDEDNKPLNLKLPIDLTVTNYNLQELEVKNVSIKQDGYKKAQIKFDMNEISKSDLDKREIKVTKLWITNKSGKTIKEFKGNDLSFGTKEITFDASVGSHDGYQIKAQYTDANYPDRFGGVHPSNNSPIPSFEIKKMLSITQKIIIGASSGAAAIIIILIALWFVKKAKHSNSVRGYRRNR